MRPETREAMEKLWSAKWNLPKAAKHANLTNKEMKITFNEYCAFHPPSYATEESIVYLTGQGDCPDTGDDLQNADVQSGHQSI